MSSFRTAATRDPRLKVLFGVQGRIAAIARECHVTFMAVSQWRLVPLRHADAVSRVTGVPVEQLPLLTERSRAQPDHRDARLQALFAVPGRIAEIARACQVGQTAVSKWSLIPRMHADAISRATGVPVDHLPLAPEEKTVVRAEPPLSTAFLAPKTWNDRSDAELRRRHAKGESFGEIAAVLKLSKSAVIGRAHRLKLPSRPSPIVRASVQARKPPAAAKPKTLQVQAVAAVPTPRSISKRNEASTIIPAPRRAAIPVIPVEAPPRVLADRPCSFPLGDPRQRRDFRYCDAPSRVGSSYCPEHHAVCFAGLPKQRSPRSTDVSERRREQWARAS